MAVHLFWGMSGERILKGETGEVKKMKVTDKNRRLWYNQILTVNSLKVGIKVKKIYSHIEGYTESYIIHKLKEDHFTYFKNGSEEKCFYSDSNLTPYSSGWNQTNYLVKE